MENGSRRGQKKWRILKRVRFYLVNLIPLWLILIAPFLLFPNPIRALALLGLPLLWGLQKLEKGYFIRRTILDWPILVILLMIIVSMFATPDMGLSLPKITGLLLHIAVFYAVVETVQTKQGLLRSLSFFLLLGIATVGLGLLSTDWLFKIPVINRVVRQLPQVIQGLPGAETGIHPNQLAGTLLWFFPIQLSLILMPKRQYLSAYLTRFVPLSLWLIFLLTIGTFVLTQSRGGFLGGIAAFATLGALRSKRLRWLLLFGSIIGIIIGSVIGWSTISSYIFSDTTQAAVGSLGTLNFRMEIWRAALWGIADFPFTGMGMGTFREVARLLYPLNVDPNFNISDAHNQFLQAALDLGMPGLVAFIALWLGVGYALMQLIRNTDDGLIKALSIGVASSLLGYFVFGFSNIVAFGAKPGVFFWWLLACAVGLYQAEMAHPAQQK